LLALAACTAEPPQILSTTPIGDTRDQTGPYRVQSVIRELRSGDRVEVRYTTGAEAGPYIPIQADVSGGIADGEIPGQPAGTHVYYYVAVVRDGSVAVTDPSAAAALKTVGNPTSDAAPIVIADAGLPADAAPPTKTYAFRVLARSGACRADTDCATGEICPDKTCRAYTGDCVGLDAGNLGCPDGYSCDTTRTPELCVIMPKPCNDDTGCPSVETCDPDRLVCVARAPCQSTADCAANEHCDDSFGLCFAN
jgi:hypothetical protein